MAGARLVHASGIQVRFERVTFQQFHNHIVQVVLNIEVEDLDNIGMPQRCDCAGLPAEAGQELRFFHQVGAQNFDGHIPVELRMIGFERPAPCRPVPTVRGCGIFRGIRPSSEKGAMSVFILEEVAVFAAISFIQCQMIPEEPGINLSAG